MFEPNVCRRRPQTDPVYQAQNRLLSERKCGLFQSILLMKASEFARVLLLPNNNFKESSVANVLQRHGYRHINLHGEGGEVNDAGDDSSQAIEAFRNQLALTMIENDVRELNRIYNADQTGLLYQKLSNHCYCHTSNAQQAQQGSR